MTFVSKWVAISHFTQQRVFAVAHLRFHKENTMCSFSFLSSIHEFSKCFPVSHCISSHSVSMQGLPQGSPIGKASDSSSDQLVAKPAGPKPSVPLAHIPYSTPQQPHKHSSGLRTTCFSCWTILTTLVPLLFSKISKKCNKMIFS